ncbi:unnamed protein product [Oikopleura dioica]|uniref:Uncharacterized protein n=1 Tax=Oikopleura dioica TaxID=34765 RepID=E4XHL6_OIKDI|nr:unnamed protein product [Oikopleura dioica]
MRRDLPLSRKTSEKVLAPDELKALFAKRDEKLEQKRIFIGKIIKRLRNASRTGHFENIKKILKQLKIKDHIDAGTSQGLTALHWAAARGHFIIVKLLLENGANPTILTSRGKTAADLTRFMDVRKLLLEEEEFWIQTYGRNISSSFINKSLSSKVDPLDAYDEYICKLEQQIRDGKNSSSARINSRKTLDPRLRRSTSLLALTHKTSLPGLK